MRSAVLPQSPTEAGSGVMSDGELPADGAGDIDWLGSGGEAGGLAEEVPDRVGGADVAGGALAARADAGWWAALGGVVEALAVPAASRTTATTPVAVTTILPMLDLIAAAPSGAPCCCREGGVSGIDLGAGTSKRRRRHHLVTAR